MKMGNASIGLRLGAFAAFLLSALIGIGLQGWYTLSVSDSRQEEAMRRAVLLGNAIDNARSAQVNSKIQVQDWKNILLRGHDTGAYQKYLKEFSEQHLATQTSLQKLQADFDALHFDSRNVQEARRAHADLNARFLDALQKYDPGNPDTITLVDGLTKGIDRLPTEQLDDVVAYVLQQRDRMQQESADEARAAYRTAVGWSLLVVALALVIGAGATVRLVREIRRQLLATLNLTQAVAAGTSERLAVVTAISEGNLANEINVAPLPQIDLNTVSSDEVGKTVRTVVAMGELQTALDRAFTKMSAALRQARDTEQTRDWLKSGQNDLNKLMQGEQDTTILADKVLSFLVERLTAGVGLFYLYNEQAGQLQLASTYAATGTRNPAGAVSKGEGLIGQAVLEGKMLRVDDMPPEYLPIGSAWGKQAACSVLAVPLLQGVRLIGAIELGAFKVFTELEMTFLEQMRENIAIGFDVNLSRQRTVALLEETEQQAEELRVQQEELQQSNEELEERAELLEQQREEIRVKNVELETASREIRQRSTELEVMSAYKTEFLSNMSHELRTPLNSMLILSGMLKENKAGNLNDKQVEYAATIHGAGKDLLNLINDILDLSKVEAGQTEFIYEDVATDEICIAMNVLFRPAMEQKNLKFKAEVAGDVPRNLCVDQQRTQQILKNLIANSLKFTGEGEIALRIHVPDAAHNPLTAPAVAFAVSDTGIGVAADKQSLIFDAFKQADGGISRKYGGTGLGLSISRQLAKKMGGELRMSSELGKGSVFTLYLPLARQPDPDTSAQSHESTSSTAVAVSSRVESPTPAVGCGDRAQLKPDRPSILIIEDDQNFSRILSDFVQTHGFAALVAADGQSGIAMANQFAPSAILLDVMLPKVDGWGVMNSLKGNLQTRHIPVHFITCLEDRKKAMDMGAIGFVTKPVNSEQMEEVLRTVEEALAKSVKNLLIVEDNEDQTKSLVALLSARDLVITVASTGAEAIQLLGSGRFDCLVLDLGLADMSGFELLEHMQEMEQAKRIPVIIHSGRDLTHEEERELHRYAESIIVKGANSPARLLNEVTLFLHMVESRLELSKQKMLRASIEVDPSLEGKTVLIVDDDIRNIFSLSSLLIDTGLTVVEAGSGLEALARLADTTDIDIVLMDIMMPEMDGFEAMRRMRSNPRYRALPVIAMTAKAMQGDQQKCIDAGASDYISKPIDTQRLKSLLRVWTNRH